jgi:hypothetical protein
MGKSAGMESDNDFSKLELVRRTRSGGSGRTRREYLDFVVDGQSLHDLLDPGDLIGCLGWQSEKSDDILKERLLLKQPSEIGGNRYLIYVCPECGDIGCGAITVQIQKSRQGVVWSSFIFQNNFTEAMSVNESYSHVGPYVFDKHQYWSVISTSPKTISR